MNGLDKVGEDKKAMGRCRAFVTLGRILRKQSVWKSGVVSMLALLGALSSEAVWAQQNVNVRSTPVLSASSWTTPDGRQAVELGARNATARKANHIRQTSTFVQDDLLDDVSLPQYSQELEDPTDYASPSMSSDVAEPGYDDLAEVEEIPTQQVLPQNVEPQDVEPLTTTAAPSVAIPAAPAVPAAPKPAPVLSTEVKNYPQGNVNGAVQKGQGNFSNAVSNAPRYSTNPYSRIGQAEYNPNQFYGGGGNYTVNGYRQTPPAAAYGQSLCGDSCYDGQCGGCCGLFGGLLQNMQLEGGAAAMRSPLDYEDNGNAGADVALNWGSSRPVLFGLNVQAGARGVFTDFYGTESNGFSTTSSRNQLFWTAGVYFRAPIGMDGWSGGVVYDSLRENYYRKYNLSQLRAELSYNFTNFCEIGFRGAFALDEDWCEFLKLDDELAIDAKATGTSYYTMFIRKRSMEGAEAMLYGGATEWGEGLVGASGEAPLSDSFAIRGNASFVFPKERGLKKHEEQSWNLSMGLVWYVGGGARNGVETGRPLFEVADNGSFLQNFLR